MYFVKIYAQNSQKLTSYLDELWIFFYKYTLTIAST